MQEETLEIAVIWVTWNCLHSLQNWIINFPKYSSRLIEGVCYNPSIQSTALKKDIKCCWPQQLGQYYSSNRHSKTSQDALPRAPWAVDPPEIFLLHLICAFNWIFCWVTNTHCCCFWKWYWLGWAYIKMEYEESKSDYKRPQLIQF